MKRNILSFCLIALLANVMYAQSDDAVVAIPWCEHFDNGDAEGWRFVNADGNGLGWSVADYEPYDGNYSLYGPAFSNDEEDNWAITPALVLPTTELSIVLSWRALAHSSYSEAYEVLVTTGGAADLDGYEMVFAETLSGGYFERQVDLSQYAGQTVYVAFRHRSRFQNFICVDAVCVTLVNNSAVPPSVVLHAPDSVRVNTDVLLWTTSERAASFRWEIPGASTSSSSASSVTTSWPQSGTYNIKVTAYNDAGEASSEASIVVCDKSALRQADAARVSVFPNPTTGLLTITAEGLEGVELYDGGGRRVLRCDASGDTVTLSPALPAGSYILVVHASGVATTRTVVRL